MIAIGLVAGLVWVFPRVREIGHKLPVADEKVSIPARHDRAEPGQENLRNPENASVQGPRSFTVDELVAIYQSQGAAAAIAAAKSMSEPERASQVVFILTYLARIDPEFVAGELKEAGLDRVHQGFVVNAVLNNSTDGKKVLEWAISDLTGDLLNKAVGGALRILARTDPYAALSHLETMPASGSRSQALADIFSSWGGCDPIGALKLISENFPTDDRASAISSVIAGWSWSHPADAAAWVEAIQNEALRVSSVGDVVRSWKMKSPAEATAWVESLPEGPGKEAGREVINTIEEVISCGPVASRGPDESWKTKTVATMENKDLWNWVGQDPEGARKFLGSAPDGKGLVELAGVVEIGIAMKEGPEAAFAWAQTLRGEAGKEALRCAVISWAGSDPAAAAEKLKTTAPEQRAPLAITLAENWSRSDPAAAAVWVAAFDGAEQKTLVREILQQWTDSQPREAYAWLGNLPMGPSRDEGINYLMRREASGDPESVVPWIELLSEPKLREEMRRDLDGYLERPRK